MTGRTTPTLLPYSLLVGQETLKLALELTYVAPREPFVGDNITIADLSEK